MAEASIASLLIDALAAKATADIKDADARIAVYLKNAVGIGEHPQITEELTKLIDQKVTALDRQGVLESIAAEYGAHGKGST